MTNTPHLPQPCDPFLEGLALRLQAFKKVTDSENDMWNSQASVAREALAAIAALESGAKEGDVKEDGR